MNLIFPGTGSAFTLKNFNSCMLIEHNGKNFLVDGGADIRFSLNKIGKSYKDIDAVYISHCHGDHSGCIEYLAFCNYFDPTCKDKIQLFGNTHVIRKGWNDSWKGGLESVQGKVMTLEDYFDINMIKDNSKFYWEGLEFSIVQMVHIFNGYSIVPSYGLMIYNPDLNKKILFTADSQHNPNQLLDFYKEADIIIHDCETTPFKSGVHANYLDLINLNKEIKNKMYLVHYQDNVIVDGKYWNDKANDDGFRGFIQQSQTIKESELFVGLD